MGDRSWSWLNAQPERRQPRLSQEGLMTRERLVRVHCTSSGSANRLDGTVRNLKPSRWTRATRHASTATATNNSCGIC